MIEQHKYDYEFKINLINRIEPLKKEQKIDIFNILSNDTNDYIINSNACFIHIHNLKDDTYELLDKFVQLCELRNKLY
jgi:hypothetical protein